GARVARPGDMALVARRADDRGAAAARASLAGVGVRSRVGVGAHGPVIGRRVAALTGARVARAGDVALIARTAHDRVAPDAGTRRASVALRARVAVVARGGVRLLAVGRASARAVARLREVAAARVGGAAL